MGRSLRAVEAPKAPAKSPAGSPPPNDLDAERFVLAHVLTRGSIRSLRDIVSRHDFFAPMHQALWAIAIELDDREIDPSFPAVQGLLRDRGQLTRDAEDLLRSLREIGFESGRGLESTARRVAGLGLRRRMLGELWQALAEGYGDVGDEREWMADIGTRVSRVVTESITIALAPIADPMRAAVESAQTAQRRASVGAIAGVSTGFGALDDLTGGLHRRELTLLTGPTGRGKSALAACFAANVARRGHGVMFFNLEDSAEHVASRMACAQGRVNFLGIRNGKASDVDQARFLNAADWVARLPILISDKSDVTPQDIEGRARRSAEWFDARSTKLALIIVDYVQNMDVSRLVSERETRERQLSEGAKCLLRISERLDVPVLGLAQLNDQGEIRESKSILMHAQNWFDIVRDDEPSHGGAEATSVRIKKQRHGPQNVSAPMWFFKHFVLFTEDERPAP